MSLPSEVIAAIQEVRETGQVNMLDREAVIAFLGHGSYEAALLRETDPNEWSNIIVETFPEVKRKGRKKKVDEIQE